MNSALHLSPKYNETKVEHSITLYAFGSSPNAQKIVIFLEFLGLDYNYKKIDIYSNEHKQDWFLKLNPNGRIPVLTDLKQNKEKPITIFESGAILTYLSEEYDSKSMISYSLKRINQKIDDNLYEANFWDQLNWLMFQISDHSPFQGQLSFFLNAQQQIKGHLKDSKEIDYAVEWYKAETIQVFNMYEDRLLNNNGWIVGSGVNIVDISMYPWICRAKTLNIFEFDKFPEICKWIDRLEMFESVRKSIKIYY